MPFANSSKRLYGDPRRRQQQHARNDRRRQRLGFPMAVRMIFVSRLGCHYQASPNNNRTENIRQGFDCVRDQRMRVSQDPRYQFSRGQQTIDGQAEKRGTQPASEPLIRHVQV